MAKLDQQPVSLQYIEGRLLAVDYPKFSPQNVITTGLWISGRNTNGQLGTNESPGTVDRRSSPVQIAGTWTAIGTGDDTNAALKTDGTLWIWGLGSSGQLGNAQTGVTVLFSSPIQVPGIWSKVVCAGTTGLSSFAIKSDGTLWSWGSNQQGCLGLNLDPTPVPLVSSPQQVGQLAWQMIASSGATSSAAIRYDGTLWTWGLNTSTQLGNSDQFGARQLSPVQIGSNIWLKVTVGAAFMAAIRQDGSLWTWGDNTNGQLGLGTTGGTSVSSPLQVPGAWLDVSCGNSHVLALRADGTLWAWGLNTSGQLGDTTVTLRNSPVQVSAFTWSMISAGNDCSGAIRSDSTAWVWGGNAFGQLGLSDIVNRSSPVQLAGSWFGIGAGTDNIMLKTVA